MVLFSAPRLKNDMETSIETFRPNEALKLRCVRIYQISHLCNFMFSCFIEDVETLFSLSDQVTNSSFQHYCYLEEEQKKRCKSSGVKEREGGEEKAG